MTALISKLAEPAVVPVTEFHKLLSHLPSCHKPRVSF